MQFEADDCGRNVVIFSELQLVFIDRVHRKNVMMRLVALWWAWAAVSVGAEIGAALNDTFRHELLFLIAGVLRYRSGRRGNVEDDPVPEATASRCVRIVNSNGEALSVGRRSAPA